MARDHSEDILGLAKSNQYRQAVTQKENLRLVLGNIFNWKGPIPHDPVLLH